MRTTIRDAIAADGTLSALLTGGVHATREISPALAAAAYDANGELLPCALVKISSDISDGPDEIGSLQAVDIYLYERAAFTNIDAALPALYTLFHRQKIGVAADGVMEMRWSNDVRDQEDSALRCNMHLSTFVLSRYRG